MRMLPDARAVAVTAACTVLLSAIAHGMTAHPLIMLLRRGQDGSSLGSATT